MSKEIDKSLPVISRHAAEAAALPAVLQKDRMREFPKNHNLGRIYIRKWESSKDDSATNSKRSFGPNAASLSETGWRPLANAQGKVEIPAGFEVALKINRYSVSELSALSALAPDDIQTLILSECPIADEHVRELVRFTGLQALDLSGTNITDAGLSHLPQLINLRNLSLSNIKGVSNQGLVHLQLGLPRFS